jgi:RHS repeat-associated protein
VGNRLSKLSDGVVETGVYEFGSNRLMAFGSTQYTFDPNGNTTSVSTGQTSALTYRYSPHNRLSEVVDDAASTSLATYRYDALGQRVEKVSAAQTRKFLYGPNGELLAVTDGAGNVLHEFVYLDGQPVADLFEVAAAPPQEVPGETVIDDGQANVFGANWQTKSSTAAFNGAFVQNRKRENRGVYWYIDETGASGAHDIFVRWVNPAGDGSSTRYGVRVINQQQSGYDSTGVVVNHADHQEGDWVLLGNFDIKPHHGSIRQMVELTGFDNRYGFEGTFLEADAVKLVPTFVPAGSSDIRFIHGDHLGTPQLVTDESGRAIWSASYLPFGEATVDEDPDGDGVAYELNLRFPGQYYDAESELHYNYFRDYNPAIGRYTQPDPIGVDGGLNVYEYAIGNPLVNFDPFGLWVKRCGRQLGNPFGPNRSLDNPIRHEYLVVSGSILSFQAGENWFWSQGRLDTEGEDPDRTCPLVCGDEEFDKYVVRAAETIGTPNYCLFATPGTIGHALGARNCQTWVDDVLELAKKNYLNDVSCPRCFQ